MAYGDPRYPGFGNTSPYGTQNAFAPKTSGFGAFQPTTVPPPTTTKPRNPFTAGASTGVQNYFNTPASGGWGWNASSPGNLQQSPMPATGMSAFQPATQSGTYLQAPGPAMGSSFEPAPVDTSMDVATPMPGFDNRQINTVTGDAFIGGAPVGNVNPPNVDVLTPQPEFNAPATQPGFNVPGFQAQYGTLGNIQDYMNPYLDSIIDRGNRNILASASARGLLGSSGTGNELGDWAARAQADAYEQAFNKFAADRGYMTDTYRDSRDFDYRNFRDTNAWNYGLYGDEWADWNQRMKDWYAANSGLVNTGIGAAGTAGDIQGDLGWALAMLYGNRGDVGANSAINQGGINNSAIDAIISLLTLGMGGK